MTRVIMYENNSVYVDDYKCIKDIEENYICIICDKRKLVINGQKLKIKYFDGIEVLIYGYIDNLSWI